MSVLIPYKKKYWRGTKFGELVNYNKIAIFYLANVFCTRLTQNLARDPSAVAVI